jgi:CO/xanthine dehydrogenase Mo-binding subunit
LDVLAERLGQDPLELRRKNGLVVGDETITGQRLEASAGLREVLERVEESSEWETRRAAFARDKGTVRRGIGVAGRAVQDAAGRVRGAIDAAVGESGLGWKDAVALCVQKRVGLAALGWAAPPEPTFDIASGQGEAYPAYTFSVCVAEVEVDTSTGETHVTRLTSGHDVGRVVNPTAAEGCVEGGVVQGIGFALLEGLGLHEGSVQRDDLSAYALPTSLDAPEVRVVFVEHPHPWGPAGAKGLAEAPAIAVAPAVTAAIAHATGVRIADLPATPERVFFALQAAGEAKQRG